MDYKQRLEEEVRASGRRTEERLALWETLVRSFELSGPDGIQDDLAQRMGQIRRRFDDLQAELEDML